MTEQQPALEQWRELYALATHLKQLAPWEWMRETDIFGVQSPDSGETGFASIMGQAGEHYAVSFYRGTEGIYGFRELQHASPYESPERLLEIPQLQVSFENRELLQKPDLDTIKRVGRRFRGKHAWPLFRSMRPGFQPWFLEAEEASFLRHALAQVSDVASRFKRDAKLLDLDDEMSYLVRVSREENGALTWRDEVRRVPPPGSIRLHGAFNRQALEALAPLAVSPVALEVDFFILPAAIGEEGERPRSAYMLLMVEAQSGMIVGNDLLIVESSLETLWDSLPAKLIEQLLKFRRIPGEIRVRSPRLAQCLEPLAKALDVRLKQTHSLLNVDAVKESLRRFVM
jgi:hypothetical protein